MKKAIITVVFIGIFTTSAIVNAAGWNWACRNEDKNGACTVTSLGVDPVNNRLNFEVDILETCDVNSDCSRTAFRVNLSDMTMDEFKLIQSLLLVALTKNTRIKFTVVEQGSDRAEKIYLTE